MRQGFSSSLPFFFDDKTQVQRSQLVTKPEPNSHWPDCHICALVFIWFRPSAGSKRFTEDTQLASFLGKMLMVR